MISTCVSSRTEAFASADVSSEAAGSKEQDPAHTVVYERLRSTNPKGGTVRLID